MGFELNPYDTCIANMIIDRKQCTVVWYMVNNKISHMDSKVVSHMVEKIEVKFGKMTITREKRHAFLGMDIAFHANGTASINIKEYIKEATLEFGKDITRSATTPAKTNYSRDP
jgi:hypothetical protein